MKHHFILLFVALSVSSASLAQLKVAFRILTVEGNVTIDGVAVSVGQQVTTASSKLVVHEGSQVNILSPWAVIQQLSRGEHDVATLGDVKQWLAAQRSIHDGGPLIRPGGGKKNYLIGDSVSLSWYGTMNNKSLKLRVTNEFADVYLDTVIQQNAKDILIKNFRRFFREEQQTIVEIRDGKFSSESMTIAPIEDEQRKKLHRDLDQIENHAYKNILTIVILEAHQLKLDAVVRLLQIGKVPEDAPADLKNYVEMRSLGGYIK